MYGEDHSRTDSVVGGSAIPGTPQLVHCCSRQALSSGGGSYHFLVAYRAEQLLRSGLGRTGLASDTDVGSEVLREVGEAGGRRGRSGDGVEVAAHIGRRDGAPNPRNGRRGAASWRRSEPLARAQDSPSSQLPARHRGGERASCWPRRAQKSPWCWLLQVRFKVRKLLLVRLRGPFEIAASRMWLVRRGAESWKVEVEVGESRQYQDSTLP